MISALQRPVRVLFVAAPLVARSGVYNSARETVEAARARGLPWSLLLGISSRAGQRPQLDDLDGVRELLAEPSGYKGVRELARLIDDEAKTVQPDVIISLIPQSDMALARLGYPWIAYIRGRPWPDTGEASALKSALWQLLERRALRRADRVWVTTPTLLGDVPGFAAQIVPAGVKAPRLDVGPGHQGRSVVWAARFDRDKDPQLFLDAMSQIPNIDGQMFGIGPLEEPSRAVASPNVRVEGWADKAHIWSDAALYVGTSTREAFGRSAVEAAFRSVPVVLSSAFGAAPLLYTDGELRARFVLSSRDPTAWAAAITSLLEDPLLYARVAQHVSSNARNLTVDRSVDSIQRELSQAYGAR